MSIFDLVIGIGQLSTFIFQKAVAIHNSGADKSVLEAIHKSVSAVHDVIDALHTEHVPQEATGESIDEDN